MSKATRTDAQSVAGHCRQPRPDPCAWRTREQPQGCQRRAPEAQADGVHRRLRLGQELAGVRHDRRGVAAADQRDLQHVRAGFHAGAGAARGRRARGADDRDHRGPAADGCRPRSTVGTATDANALLRILFSRLGRPHIGSPQAFSFNVTSISEAGAVTLERAGQRVKERRSFSITGGMCPRCEGRGMVTDFDLSQLFDAVSRSTRARSLPRLHRRRVELPAVHRFGLLRSGQADPQVHQERAARLPAPRAGQDEDRGHQHDLRGVHPADPEVDALQGHRRDAAAPSASSWTGRSPSTPRAPSAAAPASLRRPGRRRSRGSASPTPARCRSPTSPGGWEVWTSRPSRRCSATLRHTLESFAEIGLGYLSLDRPSGTLSGGEAQRVKMIRQFGVVAHRRHLRLRRADDRAAPARRPADERPCSCGCETRATRCWWWSTSRRRSPSPTTPSTSVPVPGRARRHRLLRGDRRGAPGQRHHHRPPPWRPGRHQGDGAQGLRHAGDPRRGHPQPAGRRRRYPARGAGRRHRHRQLRQELARARVDPGRRRRGVGRPGLPIRGSRRSNPATYTGLLDPIRKAFAKAKQPSTRRCLSANSEGACPSCNGAGVIYTDLAMMAGVATICQEVRGKPVQHMVLDYHLGGRDISEVLAMSVTEAREFFGDANTRPRMPILPQASLTSGSAISPSASRSPRCPAAAAAAAQAGYPHGRQRRHLRPGRANGRPAPRRRRAVARPAGPGSSMTESRSSSWSTTRRSWRTPTGSSTLVPVPVTTAAAGSSSRAHPPTWSPLAPL